MTLQDKTLHKSTHTPVENIDWASVVNNELPRLYNYFRYRLGDEMAAEELTSIVLEKAWTKRHRYRKDRAAFSTWLFAIARNETISYLRKRRIHIPISAVDTMVGETVEDETEHSQEIGELSLLLTALPERERDLVSLKFGADLNNREISTLTGLSESNVGTILNRVLHKLRNQLKGAK